MIEALLENEALADEIWQRWYSGEIDDAMAFAAWTLIACVPDKLIEIEAIQPTPSCSF